MPMSDSIVARRVADDVVSRVNSSVDGRLVELNQQWEKLRRDVGRISGSEQLDWSASSTPRSFSMTAVNGAVDNRRADPRQQLLSELSLDEAAALVFSEDGLNHLLASQPVAGLTIPDAAFSKLIQAVQSAEEGSERLTTAVREGLDLSAQPILFSVKPASERPVQISLADGLFAVVLKFQILPKVGELSQMHRMQVRLSGRSGTNGAWMVSVKDVRVEPASSNELPDSWTKLISAQSKQLVEGLPSKELKRQIDLRQFHEKLPVLRIHRIQTQNAQLRVSFRPASGSPPTMIGRPGMFGR